MMKRTPLFVSLTLILIISAPLVLSACSTGGVSDNFFTEIAADPARYNGQTVTFTGFWFSGFEIACIAERLEPQEDWPGNYVPGGLLIWAAGSLPEEVSGKLFIQENNPTGYPAHYGKIEVTGKFEYGDKYGHMDAYQYYITITNAKILEWTPE